MKNLLKILILIAALGLAFAPQPATYDALANDAKSHLLEVGGPHALTVPAKSSTNLRVVSYNIRWRSGEDLRKLIEHLKSDPEIGGAAILGLQEVDRNRKRTGNTNTAKLIANELGMYYAWAAPPTAKPQQEEETGVAVLSSYPISDVHRIVLPHEGPNRRRRAGLGATVKIGLTSVRVYSIHAETRLGQDKKLEQMKAAITDLAAYPKNMPAIVMGDFNTWEPGIGDETEKLFIGEGFQTPFDGQSTFSTRLVLVTIKMKLDWVWLRNLTPTAAGVDKQISLSDHWPLWVALKVPEPSAQTHTTRN